MNLKYNASDLTFVYINMGINGVGITDVTA
jgi:hypothetical protein